MKLNWNKMRWGKTEECTDNVDISSPKCHVLISLPFTMKSFYLQSKK